MSLGHGHRVNLLVTCLIIRGSETNKGAAFALQSGESDQLQMICAAGHFLRAAAKSHKPPDLFLYQHFPVMAF